jgi:LysR family transcriptional regulator of gallate degradation
MVNLRQLEYFLAIARAQSMSAAATELGVAQPTLTKSIAALEQELGVSLFRRQPRGVELTEFGVSLLRHAETVNVQMRDAVREIASLRGGTSGTVAIGAGPAWLRRHLPLAVGRTLERNPAVRVRVEGGFDDVLLRALRRGEVDFIVAELPSPEMAQDLTLMPLTSDSLGVICRAAHPLLRRRRIAMADLLAYPWVMPPRSTRTQRRLEALFVAAGLPPPETRVETESMAFLIQTVIASDTLSFTVKTTLAMPESRGLRLLNVPALASVRRAGVITRKDGWLSPAAQAIVDELKAICALEPTN